MARNEIRFEGFAELTKAMAKKANMDAVKRVVQKNGDQMTRQMKDNAEAAFTKGYSKGGTAGSINTEIKDGGLTAEVAPTTEYAPYPEFGTRFMEPEPFIKPAWETQKEQFKADMDKLVK